MGRIEAGDEDPTTSSDISYIHNFQYKKLKEDSTTECSSSSTNNNYSSDYNFSFNCKNCGHLQIFQSEEFEMLLGKSLKMAWRTRNHHHHQHHHEDIQNSSAINDQLAKKNDKEISFFVETTTTSSVSGEESSAASPTNLNNQLLFHRRHNEKPSLMKRFGKNFISDEDEEGYPLVNNSSDKSSAISTPANSQSNISILNNNSSVLSSEAATLRIDELKQLNSDGNNSHHHHHHLIVQKVQEEIELGAVGGGPSSSSHHSSSSSSSVQKETNLKMAPWYQEGIPREIALEILTQEPIGSFMVRQSTTKLGCYALSVRVPRSFHPKGIAHYLIIRTLKGFRIKGFTKEFNSLASLIAHHSVMPELLPCPLSLSRYHPICVISDCRRDFADIRTE